MKDFYGMISAVAKKWRFHENALYEAIGAQTVKSVMEMVAMPTEKIAELDGKLKTMENSFGDINAETL